jgi:hypothetical protein
MQGIFPHYETKGFRAICAGVPTRGRRVHLLQGTVPGPRRQWARRAPGLLSSCQVFCLTTQPQCRLSRRMQWT